MIDPIIRYIIYDKYNKQPIKVADRPHWDWKYPRLSQNNYKQVTYFHTRGEAITEFYQLFPSCRKNLVVKKIQISFKEI